MRITLVHNKVIPVKAYGGTERVVWYLGKELTKLGHQVTYLARQGSFCDFASVIPIDDTKDLAVQIPEETDLVHFHFIPPDIENVEKPYLFTMHGNAGGAEKLPFNTVFVSKNHAERYGSDSYVHNGLDWEDYLKPDLSSERTYFHFLGNAAWRVKNVRGAIDVIKRTKSEKLYVLGGVRFNVKMGIRWTLSPQVRFYGMIGGEEKDRLLNGSKGLLFPVRWHEPFGLALIESLYFGCPVFGTPYGSLPEIVKTDVGYLSNKTEELVRALSHAGDFSKKRCHEYASEEFNSRMMAVSYLKKYEKVLAGEKLNASIPQLKEIQKEKFLEWI